MSMTSAKKKRLKQVREGNQSPDQQRLSWNGLNPLMRKTPTLHEKVTRLQQKHKNKWNPNRNYGDDSILHFHSIISFRPSCSR
jgi:hypothetical protein